MHIGYSQYVQAPMKIDHNHEDRISVYLRMKNPFLLIKRIYISVPKLLLLTLVYETFMYCLNICWTFSAVLDLCCFNYKKNKE